MKPITSLVSLGTFLSIGIVLLALTGPSNAQAQDSFSDVPSVDSAYRAITDFQKNAILIGYPDGFFSGKRILTRYEFALAIKRAIENVNVIPLSINMDGKNAVTDEVAAAQQISADEIQNFKRLVDEFSKDLAGLQVNVTQVKLRLNAMANHINTSSGRLGTTAKTGNDLVPGFDQFDPAQKVFNNIVGGADLLPLITDRGVLPNGLNLTTRIGRVNVSGEVSRSAVQLDSGTDPDSNAFKLNLRYNSGPVGLLGGFQYVDPGYEAPGAWNRIGIMSNLTNVEGPYLRVNYNLNTRTQLQVGSDLLAGARNRSYNFGDGLTTGFGTHDFISTLSAGMQYRLWHSASLTADWEGVYWDLSAASSGLGAEAHPFESYINLGTGINLRGNAMLKMGYQIGSFGNFSGLGGLGPAGSGQTYNAFTTELNVKF